MESGVGRIPPSEVESWLRQTGTRLESWELDALFYMDEARVCGPIQLRLELRSDSKKPVDGGNLSVDSFDAMFG